MGLGELIETILHQLHPFESLGSTLLFIGFILCTFVQISPIKLNPWDVLLGWIGERFNSGMNKRIDKIDDRVGKLEKRFDEHMEDNKQDKIKQQRQYLVSFVDEGVNGKRHTKESFENAIRACDAYEKFITENHIENGVIQSTINAIRTKYEEHLLNADFATEEHYIADIKEN